MAIKYYWVNIYEKETKEIIFSNPALSEKQCIENIDDPKYLEFKYLKTIKFNDCDHNFFNNYNYCSRCGEEILS